MKALYRYSKSEEYRTDNSFIRREPVICMIFIALLFVLFLWGLGFEAQAATQPINTVGIKIRSKLEVGRKLPTTILI